MPHLWHRKVWCLYWVPAPATHISLNSIPQYGEKLHNLGKKLHGCFQLSVFMPKHISTIEKAMPADWQAGK